MIIHAWAYSPASKLFSRSKIIDTATSVIWVRRYNTAGEFELYIRADSDLLMFFLSTEVMLTRDGDDTAMIVEDVKLSTNSEEGDYITVTGRTAQSLLERRIVTLQRTFTATYAETVIRTLIAENIISPADTARTITLVVLGGEKGYTNTINKQITGKDLLTSISEICKDMNWGFRMPFDGSHFVFELYRGVNRSYSQSAIPRVVFSPQFESLASSELEYDKRTHFNSVYVAGEGEGTARKVTHLTAIETPSPNGSLLLKEKWLDSRNTSSNNGEISTAQYNSLLYQQGMEFLAASKDTQKFSGEVIANGYTYGVDYGLGDTVQVENEYGVSGTAIVSAVTEVEDAEGYRIYPTLDEWKV